MIDTETWYEIETSVVDTDDWFFFGRYDGQQAVLDAMNNLEADSRGRRQQLGLTPYTFRVIEVKTTRRVFYTPAPREAV